MMSDTINIISHVTDWVSKSGSPSRPQSSGRSGSMGYYFAFLAGFGAGVISYQLYISYRSPKSSSPLTTVINNYIDVSDDDDDDESDGSNGSNHRQKMKNRRNRKKDSSEQLEQMED